MTRENCLSLKFFRITYVHVCARTNARPPARPDYADNIRMMFGFVIALAFSGKDMVLLWDCIAFEKPVRLEPALRDHYAKRRLTS